jgi:hypothetical protein
LNAALCRDRDLARLSEYAKWQEAFEDAKGPSDVLEIRHSFKPAYPMEWVDLKERERETDRGFAKWFEMMGRMLWPGAFPPTPNLGGVTQAGVPTDEVDLNISHLPARNIPIVVDPALPSDTFELRSGVDSVRVVNVGAADRTELKDSNGDVAVAFTAERRGGWRDIDDRIRQTGADTVSFKESVVAKLIAAGAVLGDLCLESQAPVPGQPTVERLMWRDREVATFTYTHQGASMCFSAKVDPEFNPGKIEIV